MRTKTIGSIFPHNAKNENFPSPLHTICADDTLRPMLMCVNFVNGYAYATDAHVLIRQSFDFIGIEGVENLEGKALHKEIFKRIWREDRRHVAIAATPENIVVKNYKLGTEIRYPYQTHPDGQKLPNYEALINKEQIKQEHTVSYNAIGVNDDVIIRALKAMKSNVRNFRFIFPETNNRSILIVSESDETPAYDQLALVMPVMLSNL